VDEELRIPSDPSAFCEIYFLFRLCHEHATVLSLRVRSSCVGKPPFSKREYDLLQALYLTLTCLQYHGPSALQLSHLFILIIINSLALFSLSLLLFRNLWALLFNITTIESWEIERHSTLLRRSRAMGGYLDGPDGTKVRITKQEFPYDIGLWSNLAQGMGSWNPLAWFWPFSATPTNDSGQQFETNGFEDTSIGWPPPDPDRIPRAKRSFNPGEAFVNAPNINDLEEFRKRQRADIQRRQPFSSRYDEAAIQGNDTRPPQLYTRGDEEGEESWRNAEGETLDDFGVDQEVEFYDYDEDIPLAELLRKRRNQQHGPVA
jgi:palmitoyltransferase